MPELWWRGVGFGCSICCAGVALAVRDTAWAVAWVALAAVCLLKSRTGLPPRWED